MIREAKLFQDLFLPYCLQQQEDGRYAVLNRAYKPVGFFTQDHIEYGNYPILVALRIRSKTASRLSWNQDGNTSSIFLYDGGSPTRSKVKMKSYLERLELLARLKARK